MVTYWLVFKTFFRCSNNYIWQKANHKWRIIDFNCVLIKVDWLAACIALPLKVVGNEEIYHTLLTNKKQENLQVHGDNIIKPTLTRTNRKKYTFSVIK
jgi:hypothetical protein